MSVAHQALVLVYRWCRVQQHAKGKNRQASTILGRGGMGVSCSKREVGGKMIPITSSNR